MLGTGATREVSPACRVFVLITVRKAPELLNVTLPLESASCVEELSSERGTKFSVRKNVKKPTRKAAHKAKIIEQLITF